MFIPIIIPTSVRTRKKWITDMMNIRFLGGYLIMLVALIPPLIGGWIVAEIISGLFNFLQDKGILFLFLSGIGLFFWDRWLRFSYDTEIKLVYIPIEYLSYTAVILSLIFVYA